MKIEVGQQAPDFALYDSEKKQVTLSGLKGQNVLLLFFPLAFTSTCTKELCSVRDNIAWYRLIHCIRWQDLKKNKNSILHCLAILIRTYLPLMVLFTKHSDII